ncbi:MAG TPA: hypothetical protein VGC54_04555 [Planctomycetota bacterium]
MSDFDRIARTVAMCAFAAVIGGCQVFGDPLPEPAGNAGALLAAAESKPPPSPDAVTAGPGPAADPGAGVAGASAEGDAAVAFLPPLLRPRRAELVNDRTFHSALAALRGERPREATILFERLRQDAPGDPELRRLHLWSLLEMGESSPALPLAMDAAGGAETSPRTAAPADALLVGRALAMEQGDAAAFPWLARAADSAQAGPETLLMAARAGLAAREGVRAGRWMDRYMLQQPLDDATTLLRARCLVVAGSNEPALALYERLLAGPAAQPELWDEAGLAAFEGGLASQDRALFTRASSLFEAALALNPQDARVQFNLGCALDWGGELTAAEAAYGRAIELRPGYMNAVENLVQLLRRLDRREDARRVLVEQLRQPLTTEELERTRASLEALDQDLPLFPAGAPAATGASPND